MARLGGGAGAYSAFDDPATFTCADWRCTTPNTLKAGVEFAQALSSGGVLQGWGIQGGIGSDSDPIFKNPDLKSGSPVSGTYQAFAFYQKISPDKANYKYPEGSEKKFDGYIQIGKTIDLNLPFEPTPSGQDYNILFAKKAGINSVGQILQRDTVVSYSSTPIPGIIPGLSFSEKVVKSLGVDPTGLYDMYQLSGVPQSVGGEGTFAGQADVSITATTKSFINVHFDVIPVAYGYTYVPD